ncbi:MAG: DNA primase, partial [Thermodesulfobacteriota bacterium]
MGNHSYESLIREIKGRLSITNLVENYVSLKRSGKGYVGLCPFHDDKNPSFHVNEDKGLYHCFACGAGGDIVGFLMRYKNVSFHDAIQELAKKADITIKEKSFESPKKSRKNSLIKLSNLVSLFYHRLLVQGEQGRAARNNLKTRGLSMEIVKEFHLGYAPDGWDTLVRLLNEKKIPHGIAEHLGLIIKRKNKEGFYDRFRNRIIFPIRDVDYNVVGLGGRVLDNEIEPKYINSPESEIYQKRNILYGLEKSRDDIRKKGKVIIVEGYMDFLSLYSAGIRNVVATLGTSLTHEHAV